GAAGVEEAVALGGFEGRGFPETEGIGGLDVVVAVDEDGGGARGGVPAAEDDGVAGGGEDFDLGDAGGAEVGGDPVGGLGGVVSAVGVGADAGNAEEVEEGGVVVGVGLGEVGGLGGGVGHWDWFSLGVGVRTGPGIGNAGLINISRLEAGWTYWEPAIAIG